jgi:GTP-binding protein
MKRKPAFKFLRSAYQPDQSILLSGPVALFLGRSNVGKSSLLNAISKDSLAQVSKTPGKTRSINYYQYGSRLVVVDVPGYGFAKRSREERGRWAELMEKFFDQLPRRCLSYILVDAQRVLEAEEFLLLDSLQQENRGVVLLLTKADRLSRALREKVHKNLEATLRKGGVRNLLTWRFVSVKTGEGVEEIRRELFKFGTESGDE